MKINGDDIPGLFTGISEDETEVTFSVENPTVELMEKITDYCFGQEVIRAEMGGVSQNAIIVSIERVALKDAVYFNLLLKAVNE